MVVLLHWSVNKRKRWIRNHYGWLMTALFYV